MRRFGIAGQITGVLALTALLGGCHGDTDQGGGTDRGGADRSAAKPLRQPVPTPPSADQVDPNSPQAVLNGTSTTQPATTTQPGSQMSPSSQMSPGSQTPPSPHP